MLVSLSSSGLSTVIKLDRAASELGFWRSILPFGSEQKVAPVTQAFYEFDQALTTFSALHHAAKIHPSDRRQLLALRDEVIDLDLTELLTRQYPILNEVSTGSRTLSFSGDWIGADNYQINLGPLKRMDSPNRIGRLSADFTLSKGTLSNDSAVLTSMLSVNMGTLLFEEMLGSWEVFHQELQRYATVDVMANTSISAIFTGEDRLFGKNDQLILDKINESAPTVLSLVTRLVNINNIVDTPVNKFGHSMTRINLRQTIKLDSLESEYTEAYEQYGPIFKYLSFTTRVITAAGKQIVMVHYNAEDKELSFNMVVSDGGIVLTDRNGNLTSEIIYPTKLKALDYTVKNDIFINVFGLKIYIDQLTMNSQYSRITFATSARTDVGMALNELPKIRVEGALLHFVPPWLIDALIPGTIESAITGAFAEAVNGRGGKGALISIKSDEDNGRHQLSIGLSVELRYQLLKEFASGFEGSENNTTSNEEDTPLIFKDLGEAVRKDFNALLLRHNMQSIGLNNRSPATAGTY